ncbi:hypothetical protein OHAE_5229 [Ochrobactrum soli]|uniref:Uncharacterized protein n=1 Tax=Ochrobactrum soli TaxID=2448455 RepID=A0A2P9HEU3_9HYPH|nr:hypothetical protein OHAE_5229 [[Ochrobactrum] soli]
MGDLLSQRSPFHLRGYRVSIICIARSPRSGNCRIEEDHCREALQSSMETAFF